MVHYYLSIEIQQYPKRQLFNYHHITFHEGRNIIVPSYPII